MRKWENNFASWLEQNHLGCLAFGIHEAYYKRFKTQEVVSNVGSQSSSNWMEQSAKNLAQGMVDIGYGPQQLDSLKNEYRTFGVLMGVHWVNLIHKLWVKCIVLTVASVWFSISFYGMLTIKTLDENENFCGDDTWCMKSLYGVNLYTTTGAMMSNILIMFGVGGLEDKSRNVWIPSNHGTVRYEQIDIHTAEQQQWMIRYCELGREFLSKEHGEVLVQDDEDFRCMLEDFRDFHMNPQSGQHGNGSNGSNDSFPLLKEGITDDDSDEQRQYYLQALYEWYHEDMSEEAIGWRNALNMDIEKSNDGEEYTLKSLHYGATSIYKFWSVQSEADKEEANWREFMAESKEQCQEAVGMNNAICSPRVTALRLAWSEGYSGYFTSARDSVVTTLPLIFVILVLVLNNWIIASFVVFSFWFGI